AIIRQLSGTFDPSIHRDRDQDALRALIEAKLRGLPIKPREVIAPPPVIDLMAALKRSLSRETPAISGTTAKKSEPGAPPIGASDHCFCRSPAAESGRRSPRPSRPPSR